MHLGLSAVGSNQILTKSRYACDNYREAYVIHNTTLMLEASRLWYLDSGNLSYKAQHDFFI